MSLDTPLTGAPDWTPGGPLTPITDEEQQRLVGLEEVIEAGLVSFVAVGTALAEVRDDRLYRESHPTFEAYCAERWSMGRAQAYRLIGAAEVVSPMGDTAALVTNERQARELAAVPAEERSDLLAEVAAEGPVTASAIAAKNEARHPKPAAASPPGAAAPTPAPSPASPAVETGQEPEKDVCVGCGAIDPPGFAGEHCVDCWEATEVARSVAGKPAQPKPPTLRDRPEVKEVDRVWAPQKALAKGLRSMLPALEVMEVLPADSLESFDHLADEAIAWGKRWKEERKAATRLRLMGVKEVRR